MCFRRIEEAFLLADKQEMEANEHVEVVPILELPERTSTEQLAPMVVEVIGKDFASPDSQTFVIPTPEQMEEAKQRRERSGDAPVFAQ